MKKQHVLGNSSKARITPSYNYLKFLLTLLVLFSTQIEFSFAQVYDAPGVEWNKYHYPTKKPNGITQTEAQSGEDWHYDVKPVYQSGTQIGYICAGYSSFVNTSIGSEPCYSEQIDTDKPDLKIMEYCGYRMGATRPKLAFIDMKGEVAGYNASNEWYKVYGVANGFMGSIGRFYSVQPTDDGGYIAVGSLALSNGIGYNPTNAKPSGDNLASYCPNKRVDRCYIIKVNSSGNLIWQYTYCLSPLKVGDFCLKGLG